MAFQLQLNRVDHYLYTSSNTPWNNFRTITDRNSSMRQQHPNVHRIGTNASDCCCGLSVRRLATHQFQKSPVELQSTDRSARKNHHIDLSFDPRTLRHRFCWAWDRNSHQKWTDRESIKVKQRKQNASVISIQSTKTMQFIEITYFGGIFLLWLWRASRVRSKFSISRLHLLDFAQSKKEANEFRVAHDSWIH